MTIRPSTLNSEGDEIEFLLEKRIPASIMNKNKIMISMTIITIFVTTITIVIRATTLSSESDGI
jgi:hypothetical protein